VKVFSISDFHLSNAKPKAMDIFGDHWKDHFDKIKQACGEQVGSDDVLLIAGDISWAMHLDEALADLQAIAELPGKKVMIRGNHDYWWSSPRRIREVLPEGISIIQNDCVTFDPFCVAGSRGWMCPAENAEFDATDEKIYKREALRLEMALNAAKKTEKPIIVMIHYPPFNDRQAPSLFTDLFERFGVKHVVYGHLHGPGAYKAFTGELRGVHYHLTSCDYLGFQPIQIDAF